MRHVYITILILSSIYLLMITILFHSKLKQKTIENRLYRSLITINLVSIFWELLLCFSASAYGSSIFFNSIYLLIGKIFVCCIFTWTFVLLLYTIFLGQPEEKSRNIHEYKILPRIVIYSYSIIFFLIFSLPITFYETNTIAYTEGDSVTIGFCATFLLIFIMIISLIRTRKVLKIKKVLPIFIFIILFLSAVIIQFIFPGLLLVNPVLTFITVLMYHTIENPDIKLIRALNIATDKAIKANKAKSDFLSSMSHEIRTPLNAIIGFAESIKIDKTLKEAKTDANDIIMASNNLLELVNGILNISKIEANKMEIVKTNYKPLEVFNNLEKFIKTKIIQKPIEFKTEFSPNIPKILNGDVGKVKEIIINLLTNAAKYTDKGSITFKVECHNKKNISRLLISVKDTGKGIKEEDLKKLFIKFERLDEVKNSNIEGTGLGLSITKSLLDLLGGKIEIKSTYGKGSEFIVYLQQKIVTLHNDTDETEEKQEINISFSGKKILIVDDSEMNLKVAGRILKNLDLNVDLANSGQECLDKINSKNKYDLIFMDDMMPGMDGTQTLNKLKAIDNFNTNVIILTANAIEGEKDKYIEKGFNEYLAKPINKTELNKILNKFLKMA